ncbi:MAG TPA: RHS repeat-associated core domain-containing protein [Pyrinomonadaceae bacterium]
MLTGKDSFSFSNVNIFGKKGTTKKDRRKQSVSNNQSTKRRRFQVKKSLVQKMICSLLIVVLLAQTTPAMHINLLTNASELKNDFAFALGSSALLAFLGNSLTSGKSKANEDEELRKTINRIRVEPQITEMFEGDRISFSAIGIDAAGNPVSGLKFSWSCYDLGARQGSPISKSGVFAPAYPSDYRITVEGGNLKTEFEVKVKKGLNRRAGEKPLREITVSTKETEETQNAAQQQGQTGTKDQPQTSDLGDINGWNDGNYGSGDNPGNTVGNPPGGLEDAGAGSGNFQISAPLLDLAARGSSLSLGLYYNSRLWTKSGTNITYDIDKGFPAPGWNLGVGKMVLPGGNSGAMIIEPDGTRRGYTGTVTTYGTSQWFTGYTTDGSFIDYGYSGYNGYTTGYANYPNGTRVSYGAGYDWVIYPTSIQDVNGNVTTITYVNNQGPRISSITDTMGRVIQFHYDAYNLLTAVTTPGLSGGAPRTLVRLHYKQLSLSYQFSGLTPRVRNGTPWVLDAIYYPATGTGFWFNDLDSYSTYGMIRKVVEQRGMSFSAGSLNEQGTISPGWTTKQELYNYPQYAIAGLTDAPTYTTLTESWTKDGTNLETATTNYLVQMNSTPRKVTITAPNGLKSVQYAFNAPNQWYDGLMYLDETRNGNAGDALLQSSEVSWQQGAYLSPRPLSVSQKNEYGQITRKEYSYAATYNAVTSTRDYDYNNAMLREVRTQYVSDANYGYNHIFKLPAVVETYKGDGVTRVSRTEITYDEDAANLADTPGVINFSESYNPYAPQYWVEPYCIEYDPQWNSYCVQWGGGYYESTYQPGTGYRGLVTTIKSYADAAGLSSSTAEIETRRYDMTGNLIKATRYCDAATPCENISTTFTSATQYAYPQSTTRGSESTANTQVVTSMVHDFNTGAVTSATDANGRTSHTNYFPNSMRVEWTSTPYRYGNAGYTRFVYDDLNMTITETLYTDQHVVAKQNIRYLNGQGKVRQEKALGSNGVYDVVDTYYDNNDHVVQQSRPHKETEAAHLITIAYDVLGRATSITSPDGSVAQTFYNEGTRPSVASASPGQTIRLRDPWGREKWQRMDSFGRLAEVVEPNPAGDGTVAGNGLVTTYQYDENDNLTQTVQGSQVRSFRYDALKRLTHQKLAEKSGTLNDAGQYVGSGTWSEVIGYDHRSNVTSRIDARGVKTVYSFNNDPLNRLQSVSYDTSGFGDTANPIAATATASYGYRSRGSAGDLTDATQLAQISVAGFSTESFAFDAEGRVSDNTLTLSSRPSQPMTASYLYDTLDRVTQVRYPKQYGIGGEPRKVVDHSLDAASRLSALTVDGVSYVSGVQYNASNSATSVTLGAAGANQITENYAYNAQTGLLEQQTVVRGGSRQLMNLSYDYKNAANKTTGQLTKIINNLDTSGAHNRNYAYDTLGRLVQATGGVSTSPVWSQNYGYDRYGNRTNVSATGNSAGSTPPSCSSTQTLGLNQFIQDFFQRSLNRQPSAGELQYWSAQLRQAYAQGPYQLIQASAVMGRALFQSQEYANRGRTNSEYVYDLYWTYLRRAPDQGGWNFWTSEVGINGRPAVHEGFPYSIEFSNVAATVCPAGSGAGAPVPTDGISSLSYDAASNRINTGGYYYDANGNQTRIVKADGSVQRFQYDAANRVVRVNNDYGAAMQYIGYTDGKQRVITQNGDTHDRTYYFGDGIEYTENVNSPTFFKWSKSYITGGDRLFAVIRDNGGGGETTDFYHPDRLGTRLITNPSTGSSLEQLTLPFGTALENETTGSSNRRFTTYDRSSVTGLDYAQNRTYDSHQGRFTQVDPIGMSAAALDNPQTLNLYNYVGNDPVNRTDPSGLFWGKLFGFIKKLFRAIVITLAVMAAVVAIAAAILAPGVGWMAIIAAIGAVANAAALIATELGYTRVARIFRKIATLAAIPNAVNDFVVALKGVFAAKGKAIVAALARAIQRGVTVARHVADFLGHARVANILGLISEISGFIAGGAFRQGTRGDWRFAFDLFKFFRTTAQTIATLARAEAAARFLDLLGIIEDIGDIYINILNPPGVPAIIAQVPPSGPFWDRLRERAAVLNHRRAVLAEIISLGDRIQRQFSR